MRLALLGVFFAGGLMKPDLPVDLSATHGDLRSSSGDVRGSIMTAGGTSVLVNDLVWGADANGTLFPAVLNGLTLDGQEVHEVDLDRAVVLFDDPTEVYGVFLGVGDARHWFDEMRFGTHPDGRLMIASMAGAAPNGIAFNVSPALQDPVFVCETPVPGVECIPEVENECSVLPCPPPVVGGGGIDCPCNGLTGDCVLQAILICPNPALCPVNETCQLISVNPPLCGCL